MAGSPALSELRRPRTPRAERTRREILEAAAACFAERGYEAARLEDIAERVGISGPALFYHFPDKRTLYLEVLRSLFGGLQQRLTRRLLAPGPLPTRLESGVREWVRFVAERPEVVRILLREGAGLSRELHADVVALATPLLGLLDLAFEEGRREGLFHDPIEPLHFASAVAGTSVFYLAAFPRLLPELDPPSAEQLKEHERQLVGITRRLLGVDAPGEESP